MPVSYPAGIIDEHRATRTAVGVFDVCHMGEIHFRGPRAAEAVQRLVTNDVAQLADGRALYTVACLPTGGIVDDLIVYRIAGDHYPDRRQRHQPSRRTSPGSASTSARWCDVDRRLRRDRRSSPSRARGPKRALQPLTERAARRRCARFDFVADAARSPACRRRSRAPATPARTASRSSAPPSDAGRLWDACSRPRPPSAASRSGLGARDTLRLEARLSLYGNDLDDDDHAARGGARLGGEARRRRLHRPRGAAARRSAAGRRRASWSAS